MDETGKFPEEVIPDSAISGSVDFTPIQDYNNSGNQGIYKTISFSVNDTKPGLMLLCKKYTNTHLDKMGFEGFLFINRGSSGSFNISEMYNIVCTTAYDGTVLRLNGTTYSRAYLVTTTYNSETWYGIYFPATPTRAITAHGLFWGDPILISDATNYTVTRVNPPGITSNGYVTLPNGLIMQWGIHNATGQGSKTSTFPIAFPNACLQAYVCPKLSGSSDASDWVAQVISTSTTQLVWYFQHINSTVNAQGATWLAIGY